MGQVRYNQESTERQYALKDKAAQLGWRTSNIKVLDGDLGISGAESTKREDFKILVADVSMNKVGAVFALEASRLSRSCTDWHRLLELCSLTGTLIIDEDGCYNPSDFNDQLLLGLKGTMSQAELHFIRARLQGGKLNKAKKGELRFPLPVGLCLIEGATVLDPDEEVRGSIQLLFEKFEESGSAFGVVQHFAANQIKFPKRAYGGVWKGKLVWGRLSHARVLGVLKNPAYAGTYVYGRYKYRKKLSDDGKIQAGIERIAMQDWQVMIKDHHEEYISWERYLENQNVLAKNRTNGEENLLPGPAREGLALLQGLLICSICGHKISVRYKGSNGIYPCYQCVWRKKEGLSSKYCVAIRSDILDEAISKRILEVIQPTQIKIAISALDELESRQKRITKQWDMKIERADYEAQFAQRRYEEVDPSNRLVAATLEQRWNAALLSLEEVRNYYAEFQKKESLTATAKQKSDILSLAKDLPRLWQATTTKAKDRKRILRLLIKDITVERHDHERTAMLHIRWQGGATEDLKITMPKKQHLINPGA
jgi:DNA invertase Pin-like site-specific DNA recombinase